MSLHKRRPGHQHLTLRWVLGVLVVIAMSIFTMSAASAETQSTLQGEIAASVCLLYTSPSPRDS